MMTRSRSGSGDNATPINVATTLETPMESQNAPEDSPVIHDDVHLQPKLIGCGSQVSDATVSQCLTQALRGFRAISDLDTLAEGSSDVCPVCTALCSNEDSAICCNNCEHWYHSSCVSISTSEYAILRDSSRAWFCNPCFSQFPDPTPFSTPDNGTQLAAEDSTQLTAFLDDLGNRTVYTGREDPVFGNLTLIEAKKEVDRVYSRIIHWKPNVFLTPSGHAGKAFLTVVKDLFDQFSCDGPLKPLAVKLILIAGPLLLQKPSASSKSKEHAECLTRRLALWEEGNLSDLLREGKTIQSRLLKSKPNQSSLKVFSRLMLKGQVSAALKWIRRNPSTVIPVNEDVLEQLNAKHPEAQPQDADCTLEGPIMVPDPILFNVIDGDMVRRSAKLTRGSSGPSGMDSEAWGRILVSKHFKSVGTSLCDSFARFIRVLATKDVESEHISAFLASRVVPLDKKPGIRPVGVGETIRRIAGKCVSMILKTDITDATAPLQTCGGLEGGVESSVHAVRQMYMDPDTDCVMLVDAANAFNCLNRSSALQNTAVLCPSIHQYLKNIYGAPSDLIVSGTKEILKSREGSTQGCNLAQPFYGVGNMKLIYLLKEEVPECKNSWYADDGAGAGKEEHVKQWWEALKKYGPRIGYFPQPQKTYLIVKDPKNLEHYKSTFPDVNVTADGHKYLGSFIGTKAATEDYVATKVKEWVSDIEDISVAAESEPQLAFAGYYFGISKKWNYLMRTTPDISHLLTPIEKKIRSKLLPSLTGINPIPDTLRDMAALSPKNGGLGIADPSSLSDSEYTFSTTINRSLIDAIVENSCDTYNPNTESISKAKQQCKATKIKNEEQRKFKLLSEGNKELGRQIALLSEKGASSWISTLPLKECGFVLSKQQFQDAIRIRYNIPLDGISQECACGKTNSIDHSLICKLGGYVSLRHNHLRDTLSHVLGVVCKDVVVEPSLLPISNEELPRGTTLTADARLDISCRGFFSPLDKTFIDIRVLHPNSLSNAEKPLKGMYQAHEKEKKTKYLHRVIQVEKSSFTPFVISTTGGMAPEADAFLKRLSQKLSTKLDQSYSNTVGYLRRKLRIELLKTVLMAVRGYRKSKTVNISDLDLNLLSYYVK